MQKWESGQPDFDTYADEGLVEIVLSIPASDADVIEPLLRELIDELCAAPSKVLWSLERQPREFSGLGSRSK